MERERHWVFLEPQSQDKLSWARIDQLKEETQTPTRGEALEVMFAEYESLKKQAADQESLAKAIAKEMKPMLDPIRIRSGYVDKNVRVLLNLANAYILVTGQGSSIPVTDILTDVVKETQQQVADQIHAYQVANKDRADRKKALSDGD